MSRSTNRYFSIFSELSKLTISFSVALSALTGYVLEAQEINFELLFPVIGVFFLSAGSAALNHIQERRFDALMERTLSRPMPAGEVSTRTALLFSSLLIIMGSVLLVLSNFYAFLLGLLAVTWYNLIYTNLKRKTAFAAVPGAIIGAIPPVIGWVAAGGEILDYRILVVAFFFFIGQIPHFWLILLKYGKEYEKAGFPSLTKIFNDVQIERLTFTWIVAVTVSSLLFPLVGILTSTFTKISLILISVLLILSFSNNIFSKKNAFKFGRAFFHLNLYFLLVMLLLIISALITP